MKASSFRAGVADDVLVQTLWQGDTCGYDHIHTAVLIGGNDYRQYVIRLADHQQLLDDLRAAGAALWDRTTQRRPPVLTGEEEPGPLFDLYEQLHPQREGYVEIARDGDAQDALAEYIAAGAAESAAKKRKDRAKAALLGVLGGAEAALLGDSVAFEYVEQARQHVDTSRLSERWPDAYADCVEDRAHRRISIPRHVREEHLAA
jgi:hypothetical protein